MALPFILANLGRAALLGKAAEALGNPVKEIGNTGIVATLPYAGLGSDTLELLNALKNMASDEPEPEDRVVDQYGQVKTTSGEPLNQGLVDMAGLSYPYPTNFKEPDDESQQSLLGSLANMAESDAAEIVKNDLASHYFWGEGAPYGAGYFHTPDPVDEENKPITPVYPGGNSTSGNYESGESGLESLIRKPYDPDYQGGNPFLAELKAIELPDGYRVGGRVRMI